MWLDGHSHLQDPRCAPFLEAWLQENQYLGITGSVLGGVNPEDWQRQIEFAQKYPHFQSILCFGLHPYFIAENSVESCETALDQLARMLPQAQGLGELGLDFRPQYLKENPEKAQAHQLEYFQCQLELAKVSHKPCVLHIVQAYEEAIQTLQHFSVEKAMVHSFSGNIQHLKTLLEMGFYISVSGGFLRPQRLKKRARMNEIIQMIPVDRLILETDAPDQSPWDEAINAPRHIFEVARHVGEQLGWTAEQILAKSTQNVQKLFGNL